MLHQLLERVVELAGEVGREAVAVLQRDAAARLAEVAIIGQELKAQLARAAVAARVAALGGAGLAYYIKVVHDPDDYVIEEMAGQRNMLVIGPDAHGVMPSTERCGSDKPLAPANPSRRAAL